MMSTTPEMLTQLVRARQDDLMAQASQARLVRLARAARTVARGRRTRTTTTVRPELAAASDQAGPRTFARQSSAVAGC